MPPSRQLPCLCSAITGCHQPFRHLQLTRLIARNKTQPRTTAIEAYCCWKKIAKVPTKVDKHIQIATFGVFVGQPKSPPATLAPSIASTIANYGPEPRYSAEKSHRRQKITQKTTLESKVAKRNLPGLCSAAQPRIQPMVNYLFRPESFRK